MANYKEIVTKAVLGKGKKTFIDSYTVVPNCVPTTVLGCWVINHTFSGTKEKDLITISGSYDVNIWYSCENDTSTEVIKETKTYQETVHVKTRESADLSSEEIIVRSLRQPTCTKAAIENGQIVYSVEKELGVEIVGDTKVKIQYDEEEEPWDNLDEEELPDDAVLSQIDEEVNENYLN